MSKLPEEEEQKKQAHNIRGEGGGYENMTPEG